MNTSQKRIKCFRVNKENQAWSRCPLHKAAAALFVRYARQAAAVLARADICRATDSERLCRELAAIRPASGCRARTGRYLPGNGQRQAMPGAACSIALDRRDFSLSDLPFSFFKSFFGLRKKHWVCQKFQDAGCKYFSGSEHSPVGKR